MRKPRSLTSMFSRRPSVQSLEITAAADPARHAWNVLADFVDSLTGAEARGAVQKLVNWDRKLQVRALRAALCRAADLRPAISCAWFRRPSVLLSHVLDAAALPCYTCICLMPSMWQILVQDEEEMAAASLEVDGMATPSQVSTIMCRTAICLSPVNVITQIACTYRSKTCCCRAAFGSSCSGRWHTAGSPSCTHSLRLRMAGSGSGEICRDMQRRHLHQQLSVRSVTAAVICLTVCQY